jgi:hypothetical protein
MRLFESTIFVHCLNSACSTKLNPNSFTENGANMNLLTDGQSDTFSPQDVLNYSAYKGHPIF